MTTPFDDGVSTALAGFRACYDDAVFYLTQVEGLAESDPVVVGLKQHLDERWRQMYVELLLTELSGGEVKADVRSVRPPCCHSTQLAAAHRDSATFGHPTPTCDPTLAMAAESTSALPILLNNPDLLAIASELLFAIEQEQHGDTCVWDDGSDDEEDFADDDDLATAAAVAEK